MEKEKTTLIISPDDIVLGSNKNAIGLDPMQSPGFADAHELLDAYHQECSINLAWKEYFKQNPETPFEKWFSVYDKANDSEIVNIGITHFLIIQWVRLVIKNAFHEHGIDEKEVEIETSDRIPLVILRCTGEVRPQIEKILNQLPMIGKYDIVIPLMDSEDSTPVFLDTILET